MYTIGEYSFSGLEDGRQVLVELKRKKRPAQALQVTRILARIQGKHLKEPPPELRGRQRKASIDPRQLNLFPG